MEKRYRNLDEFLKAMNEERVSDWELLPVNEHNTELFKGPVDDIWGMK